MMPLTINNKKLSEHIRGLKKKVMTSEPDLIDTSPTPDIDAQAVYDLEQHGRIEGTLMSEDKINADLTNIDEDEKYSGVGVSPAQKKRMGRLGSYLDNMIDHTNSGAGDNIAAMEGGAMKNRGPHPDQFGLKGMDEEERRRIGKMRR